MAGKRRRRAGTRQDGTTIADDPIARSDRRLRRVQVYAASNIRRIWSGRAFSASASRLAGTFASLTAGTSGENVLASGLTSAVWPGSQNLFPPVTGSTSSI